jgi:hypothetical protein
MNERDDRTGRIQRMVWFALADDIRTCATSRRMRATRPQA